MDRHFVFYHFSKPKFVCHRAQHNFLILDWINCNEWALFFLILTISYLCRMHCDHMCVFAFTRMHASQYGVHSFGMFVISILVIHRREHCAILFPILSFTVFSPLLCTVPWQVIYMFRLGPSAWYHLISSTRRSYESLLWPLCTAKRDWLMLRAAFQGMNIST